MAVGDMRINRYRQPGKTLTFSVQGVCTTQHTRESILHNSSSVRIGPDAAITSLDTSVSLTSSHVIEEGKITRFISITAAHKFRLMYRLPGMDDPILFAVPDKMFIMMGPLLGELTVVGEYADPIRCTIQYS